MNLIKESVIDEINEKNITDEFEIKEVILKHILKESSKTYISDDKKDEMIYNIYNLIKKKGIIQKFLDNEKISEIMINGHKNIFVEKEGKLIKTDQKFSSIEKLNDLIQNIVSEFDRRVNESSPIVDARLKDGSRVNIILPPVAINGPIVTIRKFSRKMVTMNKLIENKTLNEDVAEFLKKSVKNKKNIFISGGTGSGKTTLLNILSNYIEDDERVITIEDSAELNLNNVVNCVSLEKKEKNQEGENEIEIKDLIKASLRMRPDRIIVGEVRGEEAFDMLQAMNTGHSGSLSTGHANSAIDMLRRLESMVLFKKDIPVEAIRRQIASAIDIIVHLTRAKTGRKVDHIISVKGFDKNILTERVY